MTLIRYLALAALVLAAGVGAALVVTVGSFFAVEPLIHVARAAAAALPL